MEEVLKYREEMITQLGELSKQRAEGVKKGSVFGSKEYIAALIKRSRLKMQYMETMDTQYLETLTQNQKRKYEELLGEPYPAIEL